MIPFNKLLMLKQSKSLVDGRMASASSCGREKWAFCLEYRLSVLHDEEGPEDG